MNIKTIILAVLAPFLIIPCIIPFYGCNYFEFDEALTIENLTKRMQEIKKSVSSDSALSISPDIKANGSNGPVHHNQANNLSVTVSLDPGGSSENCDWWVAAASPFGWYYFDVGIMNWVHAGDSYTDLSFTHQGPLFNLSPFTVLNMPDLPVGTYTFYFAVDTNMDGLLDLDQLFFDFFVVNINIDGKTTINLPVGSLGENVPVKAGQPKTISFVVPELDAGAGPYTDISIDLNAALENVTVDLGSSAAAQLKDYLTGAGDTPTAQVSVRIGHASDIDTVCETGFLIGTHTADVDSLGQPSSVTPSTSSAPQSALSVVNTGSFATCTEIIYPVDATINLSNVELEVRTCGEAPSDFNGTWAGTYFCTNNVCPNESGLITMTTITQNGNSAHYEDEFGASYDGTVCGNEFRYNGGGAGFTESGTFVLNADGTATKSSSWISKDGPCQGDCVDNLHR